MPTAVVTGAASGIGLAWTRVLLDEGYQVRAADITISDELQTLQCEHHKLDVRSPESISAFAQKLAGQAVDVLLNIAGVMVPTARDSLDTVDQQVLTKLFETNAFGPLLLTQALLSNLLAAPKPAVGIVSSRVGSIADNASGGSYAYRSSKAAVNSIGKNLAVDLKDKGVVVSLLHPGFVNTNLDTGAAAPHPDSVEPHEAASKLWKVMKSKTIDDTGRFWHREGNELPW